jgi:DNA-binding NarL/FixJ family response regulator
VRTSSVGQIVDDHPLVRRGTREILEAEATIEVVAEAADGEEAVGLVDRDGPDVVLLDLAMPGLSGIETIERIHAQNPSTRIIVLTIHDDPSRIARAVAAGASGYLLKDVGDRQLVDSVERVAAGNVVFHPSVEPVVAKATLGASAASRLDLSPRQHEVLLLVSKGLSNATIGDRLGLSSRTVEVHLRNIFRKLGASSRTDAVILALRQGLLDLEDAE